MRIIGLTGPAGSGKDSVAKVLVSVHGYYALSFAGPLKDALIAMLEIPRATLEDRVAKETPIDWIGQSPRALMQTLGTEWGRNLVHPDIWLRNAARRLDRLRRFAGGAVITDVRFENEAAWVRRQGGEVWHVLRRVPANVTPLRGGTQVHASEAGIALDAAVDSVIVNDAGLEQLPDTVQRALDDSDDSVAIL